MEDTLHTLTEHMRELPGIGPRQARRLAHWLVEKDRAWVEEFARTLLAARRSVERCSTCMRLFPVRSGEHVCELCRRGDRDTALLLVVERDVDLENIERTGTYVGRYFVLGGTTGPLDKEPQQKVRIRELRALLERKEYTCRELILACSATTEGEETAEYVAHALKDIVRDRSIKVSVLGRGLSTGTELEYVDADTMRSALGGRKDLP